MSLYLGLMSGTSMDAIDAALLDIDAERCRIVHARAAPYSDALRRRLTRIMGSPHQCDLDELGQVDTAVGREFAQAALGLLEAARIPAAQIAAIGSHGQTIRHGPRGELPFSLQIGDASVIAEGTGITTVADFRRRDIAAGGEGAPLLPAFHQAVFAAAGEARAIANIGGMANVTWLSADGTTLGFDTGPGNCLMDAWTARHLRVAFDQDGKWAARGRVIAPLLDALLQEAFFTRKPPKSTGRELFNVEWLQERIYATGSGVWSPEDVQATLCELTAVSIARAVLSLGNPARVVLCGGGTHNSHLRQRLALHLAGPPLEQTDAYGIDADFVEAAGFAWLAHRTIRGLPGNLPAVTGARRPVVLGSIHPGAPAVINP